MRRPRDARARASARLLVRLRARRAPAAIVRHEQLRARRPARGSTKHGAVARAPARARAATAECRVASCPLPPGPVRVTSRAPSSRAAARRPPRARACGRRAASEASGSRVTSASSSAPGARKASASPRAGGIARSSSRNCPAPLDIRSCRPESGVRPDRPPEPRCADGPPRYSAVDQLFHAAALDGTALASRISSSSAIPPRRAHRAPAARCRCAARTPWRRSSSSSDGRRPATGLVCPGRPVPRLRQSPTRRQAPLVWASAGAPSRQCLPDPARAGVPSAPGRTRPAPRRRR